MRHALILVLMLGLTGCGTLGKLKDKFGGKDKDATEWRAGPHTIEAGKLATWTFTLRLRNPDMSRPSGKPERIVVGMDVTNGDWKWYNMIDSRDGIRHRLKGGTNYSYHVTGYIYAPIPKGESKWAWDCVDGVLVFSIDGNVCDKYPLKVGDARLRAITISPDGGRPAGMEWAEPTLKGGAE